MRKFLLFIPILLLSSCFEVIEEVTLEADGSGTIAYTINLSQSKTKINSAMLLDSIGGQKIPTESDIRLKIREFESKLSQTAGISSVKTTQDYDNYVFTLKCDFSNVEALNEASRLMKKTYNIKDPNGNTDDHFSYSASSKTFNRKGNYKGQADTDKIEEDDLRMLNNAEFTAIYRFENEIASASNADAKISPNRKATMLKYKVMDVASGKKKIGNTITFK